MRLSRRHLLAAASSFALGASAVARARAANSKTLRVGFQKGEPVFMAAKANGTLEHLLGPKGYDVDWIEFQFGPPMLEAMRVASIDLGGVGDTPPIFAQAAHADLLYIAANLGAPQSILLPPGSRIETIAELKGKKIAFGRGSSAHNFLLMVLDKAGLRYDQIDPINLGPADAGAAFERGATDAWSIWEPYTSLFVTRPGVRTLTTNKQIGEQFGYIMGSGPFVRAHPSLTTTLVDALRASASYAHDHHTEVATLLSGSTGIPQEVWIRALAQNPLQVQPMNDDLTKSQQTIADRFQKLGLIPMEIKVSEIVWRPGV